MSKPASATANFQKFMQCTPQDVIEDMKDTTKGIVMTLRAEKKTVGNDLQEKIAKLLFPDMLFDKDTAPYPVLWVELKKFLAVFQVQIQVHQPHRAGAAIAKPLPHLDFSIPKDFEYKEKMAHSIAMRFKDSEKNLSGNLPKCWQDFCDEYDQISMDYNLSKEPKFQFMCNLLPKDVHRFF